MYENSKSFHYFYYTTIVRLFHCSLVIYNILCETQEGRAGIKVFNDSSFHVTFIHDKSIGNSCGTI